MNISYCGEDHPFAFPFQFSLRKNESFHGEVLPVCPEAQTVPIFVLFLVLWDNDLPQGPWVSVYCHTANSSHDTGPVLSKAVTEALAA